MSKVWILAAAIFVLSLTGQSVAQVDSSTRLEFSNIPPCGAGVNSRGDISGHIHGLEKPEAYKVVIYAHTDRWYVQPLISHPFTDVDGGGNWSNWTHLGRRYAALVVGPSFQPPSKPEELPDVGSEVVFRAEVQSSSKCQ
jgi:hypothetical protein